MAGMCKYLSLFFICSIFSFTLDLNASISFSDVTVDRGVDECTQEHEGFGIGASAVDFDSDGDIDVFLARPEGEPDRLYRNLGNGYFEDVAPALGLNMTTRTRASLWFDYDGDRILDLLTTSDCFRTACTTTMGSFLRLFKQNSNGTFTEVTASAGLNEFVTDRTIHRSGAAAGDLNGDGFLDLVTAFWEGPIRLYINQRNGSFVESTLASGITQEIRGYWQPIIQDFNGDGLLDIYFTIDFSANKLWINQGIQSSLPLLQEVGGISACDNNMNDMGLTLGDYDNDGDPDIYATNIYRDDFYNVLLRNESSETGPSCNDVSLSAGVEQGGWGWGATFFDANNDGLLDLAETNGWHLNGWEQAMRLFINQTMNVGVFTEQGNSAGLTHNHWGSSLLAVDIERDGDLDMIESVPDACANNVNHTLPLIIYESQLQNSPEPHNFLIIKPRINGLNHFAIGTKLQVMVGEQTMTRWITAGTSFLGQEPAEAHFGLGAATAVDQIVATWPDGKQTTHNNINANQVINISYTPVIFADGFE